MDPSYAAEYAQRYRNGPCAHVATPDTSLKTPPRIRARAGEEGRPNWRAWLAVKESGQTHCAYCRGKFNADCRPTFDHKIPKARGGTASDGIILACQTCNSARGDAPYDQYMAAVTEEWRLAKLEGRGYRRPKCFELPNGSKAVLTLSKKERRVLRRNLIESRAT